MSFKRRGAVLAATALAAAALGSFAISGAFGAQIVRVGNLIAEIDGRISPSKLPRKAPAPITLKLEGSLKTADGAHPPAMKEVFLEFDRQGHLNTKGLASCTEGKLQSTLTDQAKRACGKALIGTGRAEAEIQFPEDDPFKASGPLLIFNGSKGKKQKLILHVYAKVPAPTTFVTSAVIGKGKGPYGLSARVKVPTIVSGQGSLIGFNTKIAKKFTYKRRKVSVLTATCKTGKLRARGDFLFSGGPKMSGSVTRACTPKG
jgi:hypothetical protein